MLQRVCGVGDRRVVARMWVERGQHCTWTDSCLAFFLPPSPCCTPHQMITMERGQYYMGGKVEGLQLPTRVFPCASPSGELLGRGRSGLGGAVRGCGQLRR